MTAHLKFNNPFFAADVAHAAAVVVAGRAVRSFLQSPRGAAIKSCTCIKLLDLVPELADLPDRNHGTLVLVLQSAGVEVVL